jgi:hypothetical protein
MRHRHRVTADLCRAREILGVENEHTGRPDDDVVEVGLDAIQVVQHYPSALEQLSQHLGSSLLAPRADLVVLDPGRR